MIKMARKLLRINIDLLIYNRLTTSIKKVVDQLNGQLVGNFIVKGNK